LSSWKLPIGVPWNPSTPTLDNPAIPVISSSPEKESGSTQEVSMSSLYLRGQTWWAKSKEQGKVARWSLKTRSKAEAKRRLKLYDSQPRQEPMPARVKSPVTWDEAAGQLLDYYQAFGTRRPHEAGRVLRTLGRFFGGWHITDIDAAVVLRYVAERRRQGKAPATINIELATLRRALRLAQELGHLASVPIIRTLRPAPPRQGFFEPDEFEAVARELPPDLALVARIAYTFGWRLTDEVLPLTRSQVDLETGTLRLAPGSTKNGDGRLVYLTPELRASLAEQLARVRTIERELGRVIPHVFPALGGPRKGEQRKSMSWTWGQACKRAGLSGKWKHDLRRTAVRDMVNAGISERVAMKITGHRTRSTFDRYHIVSPDDLKDAARKMADKTRRKKGTNLLQASREPLGL
jgi:integrase